MVIRVSSSDPVSTLVYSLPVKMETNEVVTIKELAYWDTAAFDGSTIPSPPSLIGRAAHRGEQLGHFAPGPCLKGAPGGPIKGPLNTCLKDRYTLIEQSDLNTLIEQSQYSSEEQCSKLIDKEIWLVMGSYCHCQQVVTFSFFFFFWSSPYNLGQGPHFNSLPWAP